MILFGAGPIFQLHNHFFFILACSGSCQPIKQNLIRSYICRLYSAISESQRLVTRVPRTLNITNLMSENVSFILSAGS